MSLLRLREGWLALGDGASYSTYRPCVTRHRAACDQTALLKEKKKKGLSVYLIFFYVSFSLLFMRLDRLSCVVLGLVQRTVIIFSSCFPILVYLLPRHFYFFLLSGGDLYECVPRQEDNCSLVCTGGLGLMAAVIESSNGEEFRTLTFASGQFV